MKDLKKLTVYILSILLFAGCSISAFGADISTSLIGESYGETATPDEAASDVVTFDEAASDQATPDEATPDEATPDEATPDEATPDTATPDIVPSSWSIPKSITGKPFDATDQRIDEKGKTDPAEPESNSSVTDTDRSSAISREAVRTGDRSAPYAFGATCLMTVAAAAILLMRRRSSKPNG